MHDFFFLCVCVCFKHSVRTRLEYVSTYCIPLTSGRVFDDLTTSRFEDRHAHGHSDGCMCICYLNDVVAGQGNDNCVAPKLAKHLCGAWSCFVPGVRLDPSPLVILFLLEKVLFYAISLSLQANISL